jgi:hypothetical protein
VNYNKTHTLKDDIELVDFQMMAQVAQAVQQILQELYTDSGFPDL